MKNFKEAKKKLLYFYNHDDVKFAAKWAIEHDTTFTGLINLLLSDFVEKKKADKK